MKDIFGYVLCVAIAILMAVMIDGSGGVLIAAILLVALIVSVFYRNFFSKRLEISIDCKHKLLAKGDEVEVKVSVRKLSRLPSPIIELELETSQQFSPKENSGLRFSIPPGQDSIVVPIVFTADHSGKSFIRLSRLEIVDFLGLWHKPIPLPEENTLINTKIMPRVHDTGTQAEVIRTATDNTGFDDNEEETSETAVGSTGTPGYEHRVYNPGDPIKKINWKLSSKRSIYMVRLDEKLSVTSQIFILDIPILPDMKDYSCQKADVIIEGALAMLAMLTQQGLETDFYYYIGKWRVMPIKTLGDVDLLAEDLAELTPCSPTDRLPKDAVKKGTSLCFTTIESKDTQLAEELRAYRNVVYIVGMNSGFDRSFGDVWTCSEEFEFKHVN